MRDTTSVDQLSQELMRLRRRATRQKRANSDSTEAWLRWSVTMDDAMTIVGKMSALPATDVSDLAGQFDAILWAIEVNDSLKDVIDLRRLGRFGRQLRGMAGRSARD